MSQNRFQFFIFRSLFNKKYILLKETKIEFITSAKTLSKNLIIFVLKQHKYGPFDFCEKIDNDLKITLIS